MTDREKLIELIFKGEDTTPCTRNSEFECDGIKCFSCERECIADYLLANGVTFAADTNGGGKWISVDDRLPENDARVLVCDTREDYVSIWEYFGDGLWFGDEVIWATEDITHWMPMPKPPKEE